VLNLVAEPNVTTTHQQPMYQLHFIVICHK